jgi:hypothetical protein
VEPTADDERDESDIEAPGAVDDRGDVDGSDDVSAPDADEDEGPWDDYEAPVPIEVDPGDVVATARRRYGGGGAMLAAGMLGLDRVLGNKKKPDSVQVQESPSEPVDVDASGIQVMIDERTSVEAPPLERREPLALKKKRQRRR